MPHRLDVVDAVARAPTRLVRESRQFRDGVVPTQDISRDQLQLFLDAYDDIPYRVLCFLTSYINYGGRVTDYIDIRTCDVIMKSFYRPAIFETDYPFEPSGTYRSIDPDPEDPHQSYMDYIETLPLTAGPAIFGMHENANISCAFTEAMNIFDTLLTMEASGGSSGSGGSEELIAYEVAAITEKLSQRGRFDVPGIQMQYPVLYEESMNTVRISASRRFAAVSLHSDASFPRIMAVGRFFSDFGAVRPRRGRGRGATGEA